MSKKTQTPINILNVFNIFIIVISIAVCSLMMLVDIPGMELLETNPNWLLIWLVSWSIKRTLWQGAIAGLALGWIYDGIVPNSPSHVLSFILVGIITSGLQKQKYIGEDFISVAFIVFFMAILSETIFAVNYAMTGYTNVSDVMQKYQQIVIISAIITSLWSPAFYYPFNLWHEKIKTWQRKQQR